MRLYPSLTEHFRSALLPAELLSRVQYNTSNRVFEWRNEPFRGEIGTESFKIRRLCWYNSVSNRPHLTGWVKPAADGTGSELTLRYRLEPVAFWYGVILTLLISLFLLAIAIDMVSNSTSISPLILLIPPLIFLFVLTTQLVPFWYEVGKLRTLLTEMLALHKANSA